MRLAPAALAALTAFLSLDFLSAHRAESDPTRRRKDENLGDGEAGQKKKQPHIIFILIDDQVS